MTNREKLCELGYEDLIIFTDFDYDDAIIGVSNNNRVIYDYNLMVKFLMEKEGWTEEDSVEWIDYNTLGAIGGNRNLPIVMYPLEV